MTSRERGLQRWIAALRPRGWRGARGWNFFAFAAVTTAATIGGTLVFAAVSEGEPIDAVGVAFIVWIFAGAPLALAIVGRLLRGRGGKGWALLLTGFAVSVFGLFGPMLLPALHDGPRRLVGGAGRGSVAEIGDQPRLAWAEITPAYVWSERIGTGVSSRMDSDGQIRTSSGSAAPIVPEIPWSGPVSLFLCDDADSLRARGPGAGTIAGRITRAGGHEHDAVLALGREQGITVGPTPRCVTPTAGDADATLVSGLLGAGGYVLLMALCGALALLRVAEE